MKPTYKIVIIVAVLALAGILIYFLWNLLAGPGPSEPGAQLPTSPTSGLPIAPQNPQGSTGGEPQTGTESGTEPGTPKSGIKTTIKKISDFSVFDFWVASGTEEVYYLTPEGRVLAAKEGTDLEVSGQPIMALNSIEVSPTTRKALAAFGDPRNPSWGIFDIIDKTWRPLPAEILIATWGAKDTELFGMVRSGQQISLSQIDLSKTVPAYKQFVKDFKMKDVVLRFKPPQGIWITERPTALRETSVWLFDFKALTLNLIRSPEYGQTVGWSRDGSTAFAFSGIQSFRVLTKNLESSTPVFFRTLPGKCDATSDAVYCFVPKDLSPNQNTVLPDDFFMNNVSFDDELYVIATTSLAFTKPLQGVAGAGTLDALHPEVSGNMIYFINKYDRGLYQIKLPQNN